MENISTRENEKPNEFNSISLTEKTTLDELKNDSNLKSKIKTISFDWVSAIVWSTAALVSLSSFSFFLQEDIIKPIDIATRAKNANIIFLCIRRLFV